MTSPRSLSRIGLDEIDHHAVECVKVDLPTRLRYSVGRQLQMRNRLVGAYTEFVVPNFHNCVALSVASEKGRRI